MAPRSRSAPETVVVSVGGSVLLTGDDDVEYVRRLATLLRACGQDGPLAVTTGGGRTAREYIGLGRELGFTEVELDEVGIDVTRLHARVLAGAIGPPTPDRVPTSVREAVHELHRASPVILGGTEPGHTTDGVAALLAVRLRAARLVNATDVDGVYDRDPGPTRGLAGAPPSPGRSSGRSFTPPRPEKPARTSCLTAWERISWPAPRSPSSSFVGGTSAT